MVKVKRETLEACMTCPLCGKLLREATTISLCLHTCELLCLSLLVCFGVVYFLISVDDFDLVLHVVVSISCDYRLNDLGF